MCDMLCISQETCTPTCGLGSECTLQVNSVANSIIVCEPGSTCSVATSSSGPVQLSCDAATCNLACSNTEECVMSCTAGSECLLDCGTNACRFSECPGGEEICPDGVTVCNRACP